MNAEHSTLAKNADAFLPVKAGTEIAVASTKAYSCQAAALYALAEFLRAAALPLQKRCAPDFSALNALCAGLSYGDGNEEKEIARLFCGGKKLFFIGRGDDYRTALEASLKIKETSYLNADVYYAGELKHGFLALVDENSYVVVFATEEATLQKFFRILRVNKLGGVADGNPLQCVQNILPWQRIAYELSVEKGLNPDKPRNLAKSVTVE